MSIENQDLIEKHLEKILKSKEFKDFCELEVIDSPEFTISSKGLGLFTSWSKYEDRPITLGEFIISRMPQARKFGINYQNPEEYIRKIDELDPSEVIKIMVGRSTTDVSNKTTYTCEWGEISPKQIHKEIKDGTELGQEIITHSAFAEQVLQIMIESGKLRGLHDSGILVKTYYVKPKKYGKI